MYNKNIKTKTMKKQGQILKDPVEGEMVCLYCGGKRWKLAKRSKSEKWICVNGCMALYPIWDKTKNPIEFLGYSPF